MQDYMGSISTGGTGVTTVTISNSQGEGSQGEGRYLLLTQGVSPSSSSLSNEASPTSSAPAIFTITGSSTLPASATVAVLNPANGILAGPSQVTPQFSVGSMSSINTGTLLCIADPLGPLEFVKPTSISGNSMNITTKRPHLASAIITSGGVCGSFIDIAADNVTSNTFPGIKNVSGTMLHAWPILETRAPQGSGSSTTQQVYVAIQRAGAWGPSFSQWDASSRNGAFSIYPGAEVYSVANSAGEQSDTFTLSPNNVNWATNSTVDLPDHPSVNVSIGQWQTMQEFPGNFTGFGINYYGAVNGGAAMAGFANMAPTTLYQGFGGTLVPPMGVSIGGDVSYDFYAGTGGLTGDFKVGCSASCNNPYQYVLSVSEAGGKSDALLMDETSGQWQLTAGGSADGSSPFNYFFRKDGLEQPVAVGAPSAAMAGNAKLNFNSSYQVCLMDPNGTNHCSTTAGSTNATSIQGTPVSMTVPATNQVLAYNGSEYVPTTVSSGNVTGPASSTANDIATFTDASGSLLQDSGVSIASYDGSGQWLGLPTGGHSALGFGIPGTIVAAGYAQSSAVFFADTQAGDLVMREQVGGSIRLGVGAPGTGNASTVSVSQTAVTLSLGTKLTGTHGAPTGSSATTGVIALSGGSATVSSSSFSGLAAAGGSGDAIALTYQNCSSCGVLHVGTVGSGSFVIQSSSLSDASNVFWNIQHIN